MEQNKIERNIFLALIGLWIIVVVIWTIFYFLTPTVEFNLEDIFIEGLIFLLAVSLLIFIRNVKPLIPGWSIFSIALGIDLLDEFLVEPEFIGTFVEGILKASGLILLFIGGIRFYYEIQQKRAVAEENLEWFKKLVEITPVPCAVYTEQGFVYVNKATEEATGYSREELLGGVLWELFDENDREKVRDIMNKRLSGEPVEPYLLRVRRKDGSYRILKAFGISDMWKGKSFGLVALADVTQIEEERKRNEELSRMISLINRILRHDTLNALMSAHTYIDLYKEEDNETYCQNVKNSIERAINIIKNLKNFEEVVRAGELKIMSAKSVAEEVAKGFSIPISVEGDCEVVADDGLRVVFENIFQNAVQHAETDRVEVRIKRSGGYAEIRIADFGKGIPDEIKDKVFEEGFTYGEKASTGLGLYIVKKLIERYAGEVKVEDNKPKGTVFVIRLRTI
ncbi:MAG: PAS domain-containing sensor histidine kinase [Archaeoglobaceae archaeon]|nr:PAS domain-containing sensor histidine kinase [Archaeoglobaceae archaeon]MDW8118671.1 PAS domain-containing sensor histidine kinase [Archaeoglobaceae archaeon]